MSLSTLLSRYVKVETCIGTVEGVLKHYDKSFHDGILWTFIDS